MCIVGHELGHAIHYLARHPDKVTHVDVVMHDDYTEIEPHFSCDPVELGISHAVNFCCGSLGERVQAGERDAILLLMNHTEGNWLSNLFDTPHKSAHDKNCLVAIVKGSDDFPHQEFATELVRAEKLLERYLPAVDVDALTVRLERDGRITLTQRDLETLH